MLYLNILKDESTILIEDKIYPKKVLLDKFAEFISYSGFTIVDTLRKNSVPYIFLMNNTYNQTFKAVVYLKNITGAGWKDKPQIKRIQISNVMCTSPKEDFFTDGNQILLMLGYYNFDDNPIMVAWDPYRYVNHKTIRSCYVNVDSLLRGYRMGFLQSSDASQKVWVFDGDNFGNFINSYLEYIDGLGDNNERK